MPDPAPFAAAVDCLHRERDGPEPQPLPAPEVAGDIGWRQFFRGLAADFEFLLLLGALLALSAWFVLESGQDKPTGGAMPMAQASPPVAIRRAETPFVFVRAEARDRLLPAMQTVSAPPPAAPRGPLATASIEKHALLADPLFDPLGSLQISGLPAEARLSAGADDAAAAGEWAVAFGDLDNLIIELPRERTMPIRATLDLRTRAGVKITSLTVELRDREEDGVAGETVAGPAPAVRSKVRPTKAVRPGSKTLRKTARPPATATAAKPPPVFPGDPPKGAKPQKTAISAPVAASGLSTGLFQPDPKDSAGSGLSPALREDPRFMTLRGLGMPPSDPGPAAGGPAPH
ncbi:MAG: hypothetical protein B7Y80_03985 [Hyphomicrobium sp. 32-62-53]|nr:MAG: hypothetical protein B7Z29_06280 [Hyphomicrobium sp. 12-62-95]OYY01074.1 MAG: hypothetical protein B7Y80_03985 [Hyphomicrobium sp. 32-62-53]